MEGTAGFEPTSPRSKRGILPLNDAPSDGDVLPLNYGTHSSGGIRTRAFAIAVVVALSACASKPPIAIQSYCEIKSTELIDMRDRGIRGLSDANKKAVLAGDDNWIRECKLGDRANSGGPR